MFGSDYRTPAGRVAPQQSTQPCSRVARRDRDRPGRLPADRIKTIGLLAGLDDAPRSTPPTAWPTSSAPTVTDKNYNVDLLIVGSRPEAGQGRDDDLGAG